MYQELVSLGLILMLGVASRNWLITNNATNYLLSDLVLYFTLPATLFVALSKLSYNSVLLIWLPVIGAIIPIILLVISFVIGANIKMPDKTRGVFYSSATVANLGFFLYPFVDATMGIDSLARLALFDIGNTLMAFTVSYFVTLRYSQNHLNNINILKQILLFPPLWAMTLGIINGVLSQSLDYELPSVLQSSLELISGANTFLVLLVLGTSISFRFSKPLIAIMAVFIRMGFGLVLGIMFAMLLPIDQTSKIIIILAAGMPVGVTNIIYATKHNLDTEFSASLITISTIIGVVILIIFSRILL